MQFVSPVKSNVTVWNIKRSEPVALLHISKLILKSNNQLLIEVTVFHLLIFVWKQNYFLFTPMVMALFKTQLLLEPDE